MDLLKLFSFFLSFFNVIFKTTSVSTGSLARLSRVEWDIDSESQRVQSEFVSFISSVLTDVHRKREEEEITLLKE